MFGLSILHCGENYLDVSPGTALAQQIAGIAAKEESVVLFAGQKILADKAMFNKASELTDIVFPENAETIGESAFASCDNLVNIDLPKVVTRINQNAFRDCVSLESVVLSQNITNISDYAFYGCTSLRYAVFIGDAPNTFGTGVFLNTDTDTDSGFKINCFASSLN